MQGGGDNNGKNGGFLNINSQGTCKYYEINEFQEKSKDFSTLTNFSTLSLNVRSLKNKWTEFNELLGELNHENFFFSVIGIQEVWDIPSLFNTNIPSYKPFIYKLREKDQNSIRSNYGGGIGLWVHEQFDVEVLEDLSYFKEKIFESLFIKVKASNNSFKIVGNIYRAPSANINEFNNILKTILETISKDIFLSKAEEVVLMGDYNINLIQYENHPQTLRYLDTLLTNNFMPHITLPSRITNTSSTLIDHIHSNSKQGSFISGIIYSCISDHMPIFNIGHTSKVGKPSKKEKIQIRKFGPRNKTLFKDKLGEKDWSNVINDNNPRTAFKTFSDTINSDFEECFPLLNVIPRKDLNLINKFMTKALLVSRKNRNKLAAKN